MLRFSSLSTQQEDQSSANCFCGDANELTRESLHALNNMKIKFPGKSNEEASRLLDSVSLLSFETIFVSQYKNTFSKPERILSIGKQSF